MLTLKPTEPAQWYREQGSTWLRIQAACFVGILLSARCLCRPPSFWSATTARPSPPGPASSASTPRPAHRSARWWSRVVRSRSRLRWSSAPGRGLYVSSDGSPLDAFVPAASAGARAPGPLLFRSSTACESAPQFSASQVFVSRPDDLVPTRVTWIAESLGRSRASPGDSRRARPSRPTCRPLTSRTSHHCPAHASPAAECCFQPACRHAVWHIGPVKAREVEKPVKGRREPILCSARGRSIAPLRRTRLGFCLQAMPFVRKGCHLPERVPLPERMPFARRGAIC